MGRRRGGKRRVVTVVVTVTALVVAVAAAGGGYLLLRTEGSPQQAAARYLSGWQRGDYSAMDQVSVNAPRSGLAVPLRQAAAQLGAGQAAQAGQRASFAGPERAQMALPVLLGKGSQGVGGFLR